MAIRKALNGKPNAENWHMRFDEGQILHKGVYHKISMQRKRICTLVCMIVALSSGMEMYGDGGWCYGYSPCIDDPIYGYRWNFPAIGGKYYCGWDEDGVNYRFQTESYAECRIRYNGPAVVRVPSEISVLYCGNIYTFQIPVIGRISDWKLWSGTVEDYQEKFFQQYGYHDNIGADGFLNEDPPNVKEIIIDNGIQYVGGNAFRMSSVQSVILPERLTKIESGTFWSCRSLEAVNLPDSIYYIGKQAFAGCSNLTSVTWPQNLRTIDDSAFSDYCGITSAMLPEGLEHIGDKAFRDCDRLKDVYVPDSCTNIGVGAFQYCRKLRNVRLPVNIKGLSRGLFSGCTSLESLEIPNSVKEIGDGAFSDCSGLTEVRLGLNILSIGSSAFSGCTSAATFSFAGVPPNVGSYTFDNVKSGAIGTYTAAYKAEWEAVIGTDGKWNGLIMRECEPLSLTLTASDGTEPGGIEVTWTDGGCEQYELFRGESENGPFTRIATVSGNK